MRARRFALFMVLAVFASSRLLAGVPVVMEFRSQRIDDILYAMAEMSGEIVDLDETVTGNATFHFNDSDFESALERFCRSEGLYYEKENGKYSISRTSIKINEDGKVSVKAEDVDAQSFLKILSRKSNTTIMSDSFQKTNVTIRTDNSSIREILQAVLLKLPGFAIEEAAGGFYIYKAAGQSARRTGESFKTEINGDLFSVEIQKASLENIIRDLFVKGGRQYALYMKSQGFVEDISAREKPFDEILSIILQSSNADFSKDKDMYFIFEEDRKTIWKKFNATSLIRLENMTAEKAISLIPPELSSSVSIKSDSTSATIYLNGSQGSVEALAKYIRAIDSQREKGEYELFHFDNLSASEALSIIPEELFLSKPVVIPQRNSIIAEINPSEKSEIQSFINQIDSPEALHAIRLKYVKSSELMKRLEKSQYRDNLVESGDDSIVFFKGSDERFKSFEKELEAADSLKPQIRYQVLVLQRQRTDGLNWNPEFQINSVEDSTKKGKFAYKNTIGKIFTVNFDVISKFGMQFAATLSSEIDEGLSHVLADTTLNCISGESVKFSNTNTFRYRDIVIEGTTSRYTSTTREITSGLTLNVNGWVSGDGMITTSIDATVSKQGAASSSSTDTSSPPGTSEKKVSTTVRTKSGEPVIIGGLLEQTDDISSQRSPGLGAIPVVGNLFKSSKASLSDTEFAIYLVPFVEKKGSARDVDGNIRRLCEKYIRKGGKQ